MADAFDRLMAMPRNPARMPAGVEDFAADMTVNPLWELAQGVGAAASGHGTSPEAGAGLMAAMGIMSPAGRAVRPVAKGIRAYHGSPYDFDRFDISKIGTGEGLNFGGRGVNVAAHEPTAEYFKTRLSDPGYVDLFRKYFGFVPDDMVKARAENKMPPGGRMYEVNVNADPSQFLAMGTPIKRQGDQVRAAVDDIFANEGQRSYQRMGYPRPLENMDGRQIFKMLNRHDGSAEKSMLDRGIVGTKHMDQMAKEDGYRRNAYVVFDDKLIDILRKYGLAGAGPLGALMMSGGQSEAAPQ